MNFVSLEANAVVHSIIFEEFKLNGNKTPQTHGGNDP